MRPSLFTILGGYLLLVLLVLWPGADPPASSLYFLCAIGLCLLYALISLILRKSNPKKLQVTRNLALLVWALLFIWELLVTRLGLGNPVLVPTPEAVFQVYYQQHNLILRGIGSSLRLLGLGLLLGVGLGVLLGVWIGYREGLRDTILPIAQVLSPIPPIVYAPYLVALMPTFRSASAMILILGIFWPTLQNTILRTTAVDSHILDSAKAMCVGDRDMIFRILLPYIAPGILSGLKVTLSTSFMILIFAEMMGATSGLGYFIKNYSDYGNYTNVVAGILMTGLVIILLNRLLAVIHHRVIRWRL